MNAMEDAVNCHTKTSDSTAEKLSRVMDVIDDMLKDRGEKGIASENGGRIINLIRGEINRPVIPPNSGATFKPSRPDSRETNARGVVNVEALDLKDFDARNAKRESQKSKYRMKTPDTWDGDMLEFNNWQDMMNDYLELPGI